MKTKNLLLLKNNLLRTALLPLLVVLLVLVAPINVNAQKYDVSGSKSALTQATEITLNGSTEGKFYYLFLFDDSGNYHYLKAQVGHNVPLKFGSDFKEAGTYMVFEFNEYKGVPFEFDKYNPTDGILQNGEIKIEKSK
jgi:hypothetical protein